MTCVENNFHTMFQTVHYLMYPFSAAAYPENR